jgi:uncharacterized membrane protein YgcG
MKILTATLAATILAALASVPALAGGAFVQDGAGMLSAATVSDLNAKLSNFNTQTGKQVFVVTVPALPAGLTSDQAARQAFSSQGVNGVLIYIAQGDRKDTILPDARAQQAGWFPAGTLDSIRTSMESQFKAENYDGGVTSAVSGILDIYRSHVNTLPRGAAAANLAPAGALSNQSAGRSTGGFHLPMIAWILIAVFGYMIVRSLLRNASGPRPLGGMAPPPGPGYPPPGYTPGPGYYGGGGGGFWSGLLGGLGGAFLGNELFRGGPGMLGGGLGGNPADAAQAPPDPGWGADPGQAGAGSSGDWGGGGWGDSGGGDFGGGDSSGGW